MPTAITEEMNVHEQWFEEAKTVASVPELTMFTEHLINDYKHDYGTICHACTAAALAAVNCVNRSPQGGITGFQAGCIMWGFIARFMHMEEEPLRLVHYKNMLFPQYADEFAATITPETWEYLQKEARAKLETDPKAHPEVVAHWQSIVAGAVPFGYSVRES